MPIFQDDLGNDQGTPPAEPGISCLSNSPLDRNKISRKASEESIRTELCEGLLLDGPGDNNSASATDSNAGFSIPILGTSDRVELIERLKRGQNAAWLPSRNVSCYSLSFQIAISNVRFQLESLIHDQKAASKPSRSPPSTSPLLPPAEISEPNRSHNLDTQNTQAGLEIERPRSALHSGDFTERAREIQGGLETTSGLYAERPPSPWLSTSPPRNFSPFQLDTRFPPVDRLERPRSRAPSLPSSYSSSFVLKPPTSPLVQSESNDDLDFSSHVNPIDITPQFQRSHRRHTLQASHSVHSTPSVPTAASFNRPLPHLRRDNTYPYQAHQPRRSLTSNLPTPQSGSSPQTPAISRRPSYTSDSSPLHASMVGSYEESILRGRMSTTPSKPLDFLAQIGVLGLGKCKPNLRCPAHVTVPFPAVFYSYETTSHGRSGKSEDGPSPYVGQIDLENNLPNLDEAREGKRKRHSINVTRNHADDLDLNVANTNQLSEKEIRRAEKQKRRSTSPRAPPGGSYRIPEKGQLQIIIKNPNKTAVKLFLVPYDLAGMEPGTKTFIRHRSYSAGPIIDTPLSSTSQKPATSPLDRPRLRYLVHLHICCPSRGRFYLYKSIRVVFANRVPDGKEKLRNEIQLPEPRFSVYKPGRDSSLGLGLISAAGASLAAEKANRRRSAGFALGGSQRTYDALDGITQALEKGFSGVPPFPHGERSTTPVQPIPFSLFRQSKRSDDQEGQRPPDIQSLTSSKSSRPPTSQGSGTSMSWTSDSASIGAYDKLSKGDIGYGGNVYGGSPDGKQGAAESLLAKKLRDLGVAVPSQQDRLDGM